MRRSMEYLETECLHIRRWGKGSDVTGTKLRFRKGDTTFARRSAYYRKPAVAEFDSTCFAHAMDMVLAGYLPLLMMYNRFMNRAAEIAGGSLPPAPPLHILITAPPLWLSTNTVFDHVDRSIFVKFGRPAPWW